MVKISRAAAPAVEDKTSGIQSAAIKIVGEHGQTIAYGWPRQEPKLFEPLYDHAVEQFHETVILHTVGYAWAASAHALQSARRIQFEGLGDY